MTVFLQRAAQQYAARQNPYTVSASIPAGSTVNSVRATLTRQSWPAGPVGSVTLTFPDGTTTGFSFDGGDVQLPRNGGLLTASSCEFSASDGQGNPIPFPAGSYTMSFKVLQTVTTAVTVEWF